LQYKNTIKELFKENSEFKNEIHSLKQENKSVKSELVNKTKDWIDPVKFNDVKNEIINMGNSVIDIKKENQTLRKTQEQKEK